MKNIAMISACALVAMTAGAQDLRIYSAPDTVYSPSATIVAVTAPGTGASIGGTPVKVYNTGSFGAKVDLRPGDNPIEVKAGDRSTTVSIYYSTTPKAAKPVADKPETRFLSPRTVETLPGAYLQYGNGDDRLGGSKMGFLDSGIRMQAIGSKGSLLCVRLAPGHVAYLPKEYAKEVDDAAPLTTVNTGSWSVSNTGKTDRVVVSLPRRLPYHYATSPDPSEITVDLYGATDNSNWITQRTLQLGIIDYVDFRQVAEDVYRVIIHLKDKYQWGFHVGYEGNSLAIDVRHRPASLALKDLTIGLDAGHGGPYSGAVSPSGVVEKEVNLDIVNHIASILRKRGATVVMTRDGDTGPSMTERKTIWREAPVDLAVSVHNNSGGSPLSSPGTAVLYKHLFCRPMALCVTERLLQTGLPLFGVVQNFNFSLNGPTEYPEVLVEGMFMSSLEEEERLADPAFRRLVAEKIVAGLEDYLKQARL